jgi:long-subunit fatty acid transport protein
MRKATRILLGAGVGCALLGGTEARASIDLAAQYDARAVAIGGTGSSYVENGASVFLNPATLDGVKNVAATVDLSPIGPALTTPLAGPESAVKSDSSFFPLFVGGGAFRLSDRIVVGLAVYPTTGFGATYSKAIAGDDLSFALAQIEVSPAASVKIVDGLSLGLGYRVTYTRETLHVPMPLAPAPADITLTGTNYFGVHAGVYYRPTNDTHLAFTYRSRVMSSLSGTNEMAGAKMDATSEFGSPDRFKVGVSQSLLNQRLHVAADVKYLLFAASNKSADITTMTPAGAATAPQALDWKNVLGFGLGAEYWTMPMFALRGGYSITQSATPESTAGPFTPPPGMLQSVHAGVGLRLAAVDLDLGGFYSFASHHIAADPNHPAVVPGDYKASIMLAALSATYHM